MSPKDNPSPSNILPAGPGRRLAPAAQSSVASSKSLEAFFADEGIARWGLAPLAYQSLDKYREWVNQNLFGDMKYLVEHLPIKENPQAFFPGLTHALVVAAPYFPNSGSLPVDLPTAPVSDLPVAKYANQPDYHHWFKGRLKGLCARLAGEYPEHLFLPMVDSGPLLERDLGYQAGLGWVGKNTCVIDRQAGSFFFIGEILTSLTKTDLELAQSPAAFHCGTCTRCLDACPTGALEKPFFLNPQKCISYWTIEAKQDPPENLRHAVGQYFFGCDICQDVCPWNLKLHGSQIQTSWRASATSLAELSFLLKASHKAIQKKYFATPLLRARAQGLKRNALLVIAHYRLEKLLPEVTELTPHPTLGALAKWVVERLAGAE